MVSNTTIETINYIKDIEIEYNIKFILLCLISIYCLVFIYISYKWEREDLWAKIIQLYLMRIPSCVILFFMPLTVIYLWRTASWELLYTLLIAYYSYAIVIILIAGKLGLFMWAFKLLGINTKPMNMEIKKR